MAYFSKVVGTGSGFPERIMTNAEFEQFLDTSDEWIRTRTGIETRRIADPAKGESTLSFSETAARNALEMAGIRPEDLEAIIIGTVTPDSVMPNTANQLQARLGANRAFSFDLQAACSGFLYSLSAGDAFIRQGKVKNALVIGAEMLSSIMNWRDRGTCVLFGDGAGAMVLQRTEDPTHSVIATELHSDGRYGDILKISHGYSKVPPHSAEYRHDMHKVQMQGSEIFKMAVRSMVESSQALLDSQNLKPADVDYFIFHQANMRIIDMCMKTLGVPESKTWLNVSKYGNTSAATLPTALDEAIRAKAVGPGQLVLLATFGGGVTWGSALIRL
jgi:3-oxoacyl-[acyl-carrier-protein] synthase III